MAGWRASMPACGIPKASARVSARLALWWAPGQDPDVFHSRSGDLEPNWVARQFIRSPKLPLRFFIEAGLFENDIWGSGGQILEQSRHLRDVLLAKGYEVHYQEYAGG